jgi:hypothetical protein
MTSRDCIGVTWLTSLTWLTLLTSHTQNEAICRAICQRSGRLIEKFSFFHAYIHIDFVPGLSTVTVYYHAISFYCDVSCRNQRHFSTTSFHTTQRMRSMWRKSSLLIGQFKSQVTLGAFAEILYQPSTQLYVRDLARCEGPGSVNVVFCSCLQNATSPSQEKASPLSTQPENRSTHKAQALFIITLRSASLTSPSLTVAAIYLLVESLVVSCFTAQSVSISSWAFPITIISRSSIPNPL